jgi:hypothetical protein
MLYFDILEPIRVLPDADKGRLLVAMLEYGQSGMVPEFTGMLALAWGFVKPKIDKDSEEYNRTILKRQYATFCRDRKKKNEPEISFDEWLMTYGDQSYQMISSDTKWYPTTTATTPTTPSSTPNTSTTITTAAAATTTESEEFAAAADRNVNVIGGELGKNVVFLSQAQIEDLLDQMGIDTFDYYVDKLSNFIIKNNANVKNHYETILKWWQEDGYVHTRHKPSRKKEIPKGASGVLGPEELENIQRLLAENRSEEG